MSEVAAPESVKVKRYVCFVKRRAGSRFVPYTEPGDPSKMVVKPLREFLDHDISKWFKTGQEDEVLLKVSREQFVADVDSAGMNSKLVGMLGWAYSEAARLVESEGWVFILTCHPRFQSRPFSFCQVRDDDSFGLFGAGRSSLRNMIRRNMLPGISIRITSHRYDVVRTS